MPSFTLTTRVHLGDLKPEEVDVLVYYGPVNSKNEITRSHTETMSLAESRGDGIHVYRREIECRHTGRYGFTCRVLPHGLDWRKVMPGFVTWAEGA